MKHHNSVITTRGACLSLPSRFLSPSIRQTSFIRGLTDISVTDKSACLREFYRWTAAEHGYKSHVCARVSHFDREARPLATSKTHQCRQWSTTPHPPARRIASVSALQFQFPLIGMSCVRIESIFHREKDVGVIRTGQE